MSLLSISLGMVVIAYVWNVFICINYLPIKVLKASNGLPVYGSILIGESSYGVYIRINTLLNMLIILIMCFGAYLNLEASYTNTEIIKIAINLLSIVLLMITNEIVFRKVIKDEKNIKNDSRRDRTYLVRVNGDSTEIKLKFTNVLVYVIVLVFNVSL